MKINQLTNLFNNLMAKLSNNFHFNDSLRKNIIKLAYDYLFIHQKNIVGIVKKRENFNEEEENEKQISTIISLNYDLYFTIKDICQAIMKPGDLQENIDVALENRKRALAGELSEHSPAIRFCKDVNNTIIFHKKNINVGLNNIKITTDDQAPKDLFEKDLLENFNLIHNKYLEEMPYINLKLLADIYHGKIGTWQDLWQNLTINEMADELEKIRKIVDHIDGYDKKIENFSTQLFNQSLIKDMYNKEPEEFYSLLEDLKESPFINLNDAIPVLLLNDFTNDDKYWNNVIALLKYYGTSDKKLLSPLLIKAIKEENSNIINQLIKECSAILNDIDFILQSNPVNQEKYLEIYLKFGPVEKIIICLELICQNKEKVTQQRDAIYQFLHLCVKTFSDSNDLKKLRDRVFKAQETHCALIKRRGTTISPWPRYKSEKEVYPVSHQWDDFAKAVDDKAVKNKKAELTSDLKINSSAKYLTKYSALCAASKPVPPKISVEINNRFVM